MMPIGAASDRGPYRADAVPSTAPAFDCRRLVVVLVRATRYDDDGYVVRHWRGTLPSNTLSCLNGLTLDAVANGALAGVDVRVHAFDEAVDRVDPHRLARKFRRRGTRVLVALAGVQTNQLPRATDLARAFKAEGCDVMLGGFHVSGSVAMAHAIPPECQALLDDGITVVLGEVEERWTGLLQDAARGRLQPLYDFLQDLPDLQAQPLPKVSPRLQRKFTVQDYGTIDAGRGCPFNCSFCTIINVQGRTMRSRGAAHIADHVRAHYGSGRRKGLRHYFFTDDNFSRNPSWEAIFDALIALRRDEGVAVDFMMQVDTAASRIPRFIEKASRAGCVQVFIGMESLREDNLLAAAKRQNRVDHYRESIARWHEAGIVCHVGFIIGFPFDTYDRIMEDVRTLRDELCVDQASFFMLTPIPGSRDHRAAVDAGTPLDPDYNNYDSFHPTMPHARMSAEEWTAAYRDAWTAFYSVENMRRALLRQNPHTYWGLFKCFIWYRSAMVEGAHPMVTGFVRLKDRRSRRPGLPIEGRVRFLRRRVRELAHMTVEYARVLQEMHGLWLATRIRREEYGWVGDMRALRTRASAALDVKAAWARTHAALAARLGDGHLPAGAPTALPSATMAGRFDAVRRALGQRADEIGRAAATLTWADLRVPSLPPLRHRWDLGWLTRRVPLLQPTTPEARRAIAEYWTRIGQRVRRRQWWRLNPVTLAWNTARNARHLAVFVANMSSERY
jgi:radical SAM superfamily enzyme YgiQ (UPF0313 family)